MQQSLISHQVNRNAYEEAKEKIFIYKHVHTSFILYKMEFPLYLYFPQRTVNFIIIAVHCRVSHYSTALASLPH